jgi:hypothetical protein
MNICYFYNKTEKLPKKIVLVSHKVPERNASQAKEEKLITTHRVEKIKGYTYLRPKILVHNPTREHKV